MPVISVPRPKNVMDPHRPANALLMTQVKHMQHAERQLPLRYRSEIYIHAIHTEQEAAEYIREVTEAIHKAHADAEKKRRQRQKSAKRQSGVELAASAQPPSPKRSRKKAAKKSRRKK